MKRRDNNTQTTGDDEGSLVSEAPRRVRPRVGDADHAAVEACFDGLAAVEVQSIMHMLDRHSLLRLARCSKRMHADADSEVAWQSQPNSCFELVGPWIGSQIQKSLLRHLPIVEAWIARHPDHPLVDVQTVLAMPRITQINGCESGLGAMEWLQILSAPCTAGLTTFVIADSSLFGSLPVELTAQLARLTRLESIVIDQSPWRGDLLAVLPTLPALTSLTIRDLSGPVDFASILPSALHACTRLTRLALKEPSDDSDLFRRIFCDVRSPSAAAFLQRLEYLELNGFELIVPDRPAPEMSATFTAMTGLRHLSLIRAERVDDLLPFVALLVGLTELEIRSYDGDGGSDDFVISGDEEFEIIPTSATPTVGALQRMLGASSVSHVTLHLYDCFMTPDPRYAFDQLDPEWITLERMSLE